MTAGAGSGKTRVLVERYVSLLGECRISEIAAVTFTDAAASEMRERVRREVLSLPELAAHRPHLDEATVGTIHSLCSRILRENPVEAGLDPTARTLSEDEAELEIITACADALEAAAEADDRRALALREVSVYWLTNLLPRMVARRNEVEAAYGALAGAPPAWGPDRGPLGRGRRQCRRAGPSVDPRQGSVAQGRSRWSGGGRPVRKAWELPGGPGRPRRGGLAQPTEANHNGQERDQPARWQRQELDARPARGENCAG